MKGRKAASLRCIPCSLPHSHSFLLLFVSLLLSFSSFFFFLSPLCFCCRCCRGVDDGSGILHCNCWFNQSAAYASSSTADPASAASSSTAAAAAAATAAAAASISSALQPSHSSFYRHSPAAAGGFVSSPFSTLRMGSTVRARGKIGPYRGRRVMTVEAMCQ